MEVRKFNDGGTAGDWGYQDGIMFKAIMDVYNEYNSPSCDMSALLNYANTYYNTKVQANGTINSGYIANELDDKEPAVALSLLYEATNTAKYKSCLDIIYNGFTGITKNADGVYWHKTGYPMQGWLDGLYMAHPFRAEYASKYLTGSAQSAVFDDICLQITKMCERTYDMTTGLYRHAYDAASLEGMTPASWVDPNSLNGMQSYYAWGRGLGWLMMAIVDVLDYLPSSHTGRTGLINILTSACTGIKTYADPTTGMWRNVPTEGTLTSGNTNALESTSSSMFAYAWLKGVRKGYLPSSERTYALTLFTNLKSTFVSESNGRVTLANACRGGNPGGSASTSIGVLANYCDRAYMNDNTHGEAPYIWAALEYERLTNA
jgi:unsaturated rhamnogalacturonyl hydrolase